MPLIEITNPILSSLDAFPLSFTATEAMSDDPSFLLEFECQLADVDYETILGESVDIRIERPDLRHRIFNAYVVGALDSGQHQNKYVYKLELSSWLWFLKQNRNCKIFQNVNVINIIEEIFSRYQIADYRLDIQENYPIREYCVQFAETDFNFINRLMEGEGIWYYFDHNEGAHTLVITDRQDIDDLDRRYANLIYTPDSEESRAIREGIQRIQRSRKVKPNEIVLRDFDYLNPRKNLQTKVEDNQAGLKDTPLEWYDYASGYQDTERGEYLARLRLEEMQGDGNLLFGESNAIGLSINKSFTLSEHPDQKRNRRFKLIRCVYAFIQDGPDSTSNGRSITCQFEALNDDIPFRPLRKTLRPQLPGIQSATVVGPKNTEVHTDKHGRIRVHFHWDRDKTNEEDCSCWIRVVQAWAGKGWGVLAMPRVGQEVLVTYVDGDLDRPMITGIVYNGDNPPPYELPKYTNYSGLVSRSLRYGQPQHASQLTFDDNRGSERVMFHAERDYQNTVERNSATAVGQDSFEEVKRTATEWFNNHVSYKSVSFSFTGFSFSVEGVSASLTGLDLSLKGTSISFTGLDNSYTGMSLDFTGMDISFTGATTSFKGQNTSYTGTSQSMTGSSTSFVSNSNSMTGVSSSYTGQSTSYTGQSTNYTGCSTSFTGESMATVGVSMNTTGTSISMTGISTSTTGSLNLITGVLTNTVGSSTLTTGSTRSSTGSSISSTGSSVNTTGNSINQTGMSLSYTGVSGSQTGLDLKNVGMQSKN